MPWIIQGQRLKLLLLHLSSELRGGGLGVRFTSHNGDTHTHIYIYTYYIKPTYWYSTWECTFKYIPKSWNTPVDQLLTEWICWHDFSTDLCGSFSGLVQLVINKRVHQTIVIVDVVVGCYWLLLVLVLVLVFNCCFWLGPQHTSHIFL